MYFCRGILNDYIIFPKKTIKALRILKTFKHIINWVLWTTIITYLSVIILIHIPFIQNWLGERVSSVLANKLNTRVDVGNIDLGFLNRIIIDDVEIYDQASQKMICASRLAAKIDYYQLIRNGCIYISSAQIFGFDGNFYKKSEKSKPNYQFVLDSLSSKDKTKKSDLRLSINSLIIRHGAIRYDRNDIPYTSSRFNVNHIDLKDISAHLIVPYYTKDSTSISIKKISFKESSGFNLKNMKFDFLYNNHQAELQNFSLSLPNSEISSESIILNYISKNGTIDINTISYSGNINVNRFSPIDIKCFLHNLKYNINPISINVKFTGDYNSLNIERLNLHTTNGTLAIIGNGKIERNKYNINWYANIRQIKCIIPDVVDNIKTAHPDLNIPDIINNIGKFNYTGTARGNGKNLYVNGDIKTDIGNIYVKLNKNNDIVYANLDTDNINLRKLLSDNHFGMLSTMITIKCNDISSKPQYLYIDGTFPKFEYNNYQYKNILVKGQYNKNKFDGLFKLNDPNGQISIEGNLTTGKSEEAFITASVRNLDFSRLNITNQWANTKFNFDINSKIAYNHKSANMINGNLSIKDFTMLSDDDLYSIKELNINATNESLSLQSDFGKIDVTGKYNINTIARSFTNLLHEKLPTLFAGYQESDNNFQIDAKILKSDWLNKFFNIPLKLDAPMSLTASINDEGKLFSMLCKADKFTYNDNPYENIMLCAQMPNDTLMLDGSIDKIMNNGHKLSLDLNLSTINDKLSTKIKWNNHQAKPFIGSINAETKFTKNNIGGPDVNIEIKQSDILINDTVWHVQPANVKYSNGNLMIDHFSIEHNKQHIKIYGMATKDLSDSIVVDMQDVDVNYVLNLVNFHSVEFKGYSTGKAFIKSVFYDPELYADLNISQFKFQDGRMGNLYANVYWNKSEKQIDINAIAKDQENIETRINGYVSPSRNYIDLNIGAKNTNIEFLEGFCGTFMDNIKANANGSVRLHGPLNNINLTGTLITNGDMRIIPLNTTYTLINDTIRFLPDNIVFASDTIRDRNGNIGIVNGRLRHKHLTNLTYDLNIRTYNLLCYDTHSYANDTFYGTAYGTGLCSIKGGNGRLDIDINITPEKGSFIEYNAASPEAISDQQFITWHDKTAKTNNFVSNDSIDRIDYVENENIDKPSDIYINFLINMSPDATLRVLMDKSNYDYIALNGTGSIRATYFNKGSFNMFGTYQIENGIYKLTIQNIIKKIFQFQNGGTIVFGGDPYNAALDLKALYTVNSVPLSDLQIGNSFSSNNIRVDCIMNISGTPQSPHIDFDLDLPTVSNEAEQMVRTVINGEEEMNQQVVYLLSIGRFYMQNNNNSSNQENQQNQTSLAMQSLLSGTISQQINTLLGNLVKNNNWTFGANISTGDEGFNNAEYEGLLSGRLLNNRLIINGQFGYRDNANATTSFIGDFDVNYLLLPNGNISLKVYNQTNDRYFTKSSLNTQGIGLIMKKDFNSFMELFGFSKNLFNYQK